MPSPHRSPPTADRPHWIFLRRTSGRTRRSCCSILPMTPRQAGAERQPRRGGRRALLRCSTRAKPWCFSHSVTDGVFYLLVCTTGAWPLAAMLPSWCPACRPSVPRLPPWDALVRGRRKCAHYSGHARQGRGGTFTLRQQGADEDKEKSCIGGARTAPAARRTRQRGADRNALAWTVSG